MDYASAKCQESFSAGIKAGMAGLRESLTDADEIFSQLKLKCKDCGSDIYASPKDGVLEIPACTRCKMNEFERGVNEGVDAYSKKETA